MTVPTISHDTATAACESGAAASDLTQPAPTRKYVSIGALGMEYGGQLPEVTIAYECWGRLNKNRTNVVLVEHALTGDAHVVGSAGPGQPSPGWWEGLIGPGAPLDTNELCVIATNVLGGCQGSTGPASLAADGTPYGSRFPKITIRDQVAAEIAFADHVGIEKFAAVIGGSMGGMRAIEWAVSAPERVERAVVVASTAAASADQIAWAAPQLAAIRLDPNFRGGDYYDGQPPLAGLSIARQIAHTTYRSAAELSLRFGRDSQDGEDPAQGGRYAVESYLQYHGAKLGRRFDPNSYLLLTEAMNSHDVGRGRGGVAQALRRVQADTTVAVVDSDRLYLPSEGARMADGIRTARPLRTITSEYGHDGFLIEADQIAAIVAAAVRA